MLGVRQIGSVPRRILGVFQRGDFFRRELPRYRYCVVNVVSVSRRTVQTGCGGLELSFRSNQLTCLVVQRGRSSRYGSRPYATRIKDFALSGNSPDSRKRLRHIGNWSNSGSYYGFSGCRQPSFTNCGVFRSVYYSSRSDRSEFQSYVDDYVLRNISTPNRLSYAARFTYLTSGNEESGTDVGRHPSEARLRFVESVIALHSRSQFLSFLTDFRSE